MTDRVDGNDGSKESKITGGSKNKNMLANKKKVTKLSLQNKTRSSNMDYSPAKANAMNQTTDNFY